MADRSEALAAAGVELAAKGAAEVAAAAELEDTALDLGAEGIVEGFAGSAKIGAAAEATVSSAKGLQFLLSMR